MLKLLACTLAVMAVSSVSAFKEVFQPSQARTHWSKLDTYTFEQYTQDFGKAYKMGDEEYFKRRAIFHSNVEEMKKHNKAGHSWKQGATQFSDLTPAEFKKTLKFKKASPRPQPARTIGVEAAPQNYVIPFEVDWRYKQNPQVVSPVKHQGQCGCCWAVSATESMEAYNSFATGKLSIFSFSQINQCVPQPESYGCDGGDYAAAFKYLEEAPALNEEWVWGFEDFFSVDGDTHKCYNISSKFTNKKPYTWFAMLTQVGTKKGGSFTSITPNNNTAARIALSMIGPQSISVAAGNWQNYQTGVFQNSASTGGNNEWGIDHAVFMVGYGFDKDLNMNYWLVKNSWSVQWGEAGYIKLFRAANPEDEPCSPKSYGPVCGTSGCLSDLQFPNVEVKKPMPF